jgi:hypothetical protein
VTGFFDKTNRIQFFAPVTWGNVSPLLVSQGWHSFQTKSAIKSNNPRILDTSLFSRIANTGRVFNYTLELQAEEAPEKYPEGMIFTVILLTDGAFFRDEVEKIVYSLINALGGTLTTLETGPSATLDAKQEKLPPQIGERDIQLEQLTPPPTKPPAANTSQTAGHYAVIPGIRTRLSDLPAFFNSLIAPDKTTKIYRSEKLADLYWRVFWHTMILGDVWAMQSGDTITLSIYTFGEDYPPPPPDLIADGADSSTLQPSYYAQKLFQVLMYNLTFREMLPTTEIQSNDLTAIELLESALSMAERSLAILEKQAAGYTVLTIPPHLQIQLEEKRKEVGERKAELDKAKQSKSQ